MKKIFLLAGIVALFSQTHAQLQSQYLKSFVYHWTSGQNFEKTLFNNFSESKIPKKLINSIPVAKNRSLEYYSEPAGKKSAYLFAAEDGNLVFTTEYRRNKLRGMWVGRYMNGLTLDSGHLINNIPDGEWRSWYSNGQLRSIRTYSSTKFFAVYNEVKRRNEKIVYHSLSKVGLTHPANFEYITSAAYSFINMPGAGTQTYIAPFVNCLHHGLYMNFYYNGSARDSGYYEDGLREGVWNEYFENGQIKSSGYYYKGKKNSGWKYYSSQGKLIMLSEYRNGKLIHRKKY